MFVQPEAISYCVKAKDFKALDTGNEKEAGEKGAPNGGLEQGVISCAVNDQPRGL